MTESYGEPAMPTIVPMTLFDAWLLPFTFWANWWSFYEEALHVAHCRPYLRDSGAIADAPLPIEDEPGLVA